MVRERLPPGQRGTPGERGVARRIELRECRARRLSPQVAVGDRGDLDLVQEAVLRDDRAREAAPGYVTQVGKVNEPARPGLRQVEEAVGERDGGGRRPDLVVDHAERLARLGAGADRVDEV